MEIDLRKYAAIIFGKGSLVIGLLFLLIISCDPLKNPFLQELPTDSLQNRAPETHLFLNFPADSVLPDTTTSQQMLYWWGEDPDGEVVAYHVRWSFEDTWSRTLAEDSIFFLPLKTTYDEFVFQVKSEDNDGTLDPTPAYLRIPVANSLPEIEFTIDSNPVVGSNPNVTHVTFPTRTFAWSVSDLDGLETISRVRYALDDTMNWHILEGDINTITLEGIEPGFHTFYVQAIDTAGAGSQIIHFPDSSDVTRPNKWKVIQPQGKVLIIDDYERDNGSAEQFYGDLIDSLYGENNYSVFEIGTNEKAFPSSQVDQVAMFSYFETVIWYHFTKATRLPQADLALRNYLETGGNIFVSSLSVNLDYTFIQMGSTFKYTPYDAIAGDLQIRVMDSFSADPDAGTGDTLATGVEETIPYALYSFSPPENLETGESSKDLFRLTDPRDISEIWTGNPPVGQLYKPTPTSGQCVYFSLPLHLFTANDNIIPVMDNILTKVFE